MADTDLSKIVGLIMENPKLIEEIKAIANTNKSEDKAENSTETEEVIKAEPTIDAVKLVDEPAPPKRGNRAKRGELLRALKPYVSSERSKAIESMISITEILDMMRES